MFCRFAAIGIGHEIQYPMQPTSSDNEMDEGDEPDSGDDEDNCPTATQVNSGHGMDDSVASPASDGRRGQPYLILASRTSGRSTSQHHS